MQIITAMKNDNTTRKKYIKQIEIQLHKLRESLEQEAIEIPKDESSEIIDIANQETMINLAIQKSKQTQKTLNEIKVALKKIKEETYGICEETGELITLERLNANPLARYSIEVQKYFESLKKIH